jgi:hypothetical protein
VDLNTDGFYSWRARDGEGRGAGGVTGKPERAAELLVDALRNLSPGASGSVRIVHLDRSARNPSYSHGKIVLRADRDEATGDIVLAGSE